MGENTQKKGFLKCLTNFLGDSEGLTQEDMLNEMVAFSGGKITMIQRYEVAGCGRIVGLRESDDGRFILYTDHLAAMKEKDHTVTKLRGKLVSKDRDIERLYNTISLLDEKVARLKKNNEDSDG